MQQISYHLPFLPPHFSWALPNKEKEISLPNTPNKFRIFYLLHQQDKVDFEHYYVPTYLLTCIRTHAGVNASSADTGTRVTRPLCLSCSPGHPTLTPSFQTSSSLCGGTCWQSNQIHCTLHFAGWTVCVL